MAWVRTSLALIAFGFGIQRVVESATFHEPSHPSTGLTALVTLSFIALGIYAIVFASFDYRRQLRLLREGRYLYKGQASQALVVAAALAIIGAVAFVGISVQVLLTH